MGAGASTDRDMEAVIACTVLISEAMMQGLDPRYIQFPDMYRIYDFHIGTTGSKVTGPTLHPTARAPLVENETNETLPKEEDDFAFDEELHLKVKVGEKDTVILNKETLQDANSDGWTPLHSCCHSPDTAEAGLAIIQHLLSSTGGEFDEWDKKTSHGPGTFSSSWTALHIAAAYGVSDMVSALLSVGANPNVKNSVGWTPLHEACHRGFKDIAVSLVNAGASVNTQCPPFALCPFPDQLPLAEACRQGHTAVTEALLDNSEVNIDATNELGWTALHEAAYQNRINCVSLLISRSANTALETNKGATAESLTISHDIKLLLQAADAPVTNTLVTIPVAADEQQPETTTRNTTSREDEATENEKPEFELLGDLPSIHKQPKPSEKNVKRTKVKKPKSRSYKNAPPHLCCDISRKLMSDPYESPFGNFFDKSYIKTWIKDFGHRCPITGQPLAMNQLKPAVRKKQEILEWISEQEQAQHQDNKTQDEVPSVLKEPKDLYDF